MQTQKKREEEIVANLDNLESAVANLEGLDAPVDIIQTDAGVVKFKSEKRLKIIDRSKVPDAFWVIDEAALLAALKTGQLIPGAQIELIQVPINYRV